MSRTVEIAFDADSHSVDAIQRAAYKFCDRFALEHRRERETIRCVLHTVDASDIDPNTVVAFRVEVLDQVLRERIRNESTAVRNAVLALAFSRLDISTDG